MNPPFPPSDPDFSPQSPDSARTPVGPDEMRVGPPSYAYPGARQPGDRALPPRLRIRPPAPTGQGWRYAFVGVFLATAFSLGVFSDRAGWLPRAADREPANVSQTFAPFWETWNLVHENYVDQSKVDNVQMTHYAILGMLDALGDDGHTTYLSPDEVKREQDALEGTMEGIGAVIRVRDHVPMVLMTMPDSPARKSGLKIGDVLVAVNGVSVGDKPLQQIVEQIRGQAGTEVKLTVHRDGQTEPIVVPIVRSKLDIPDVTWHMLPGEPYAHVALRSFGEHADDQLRAVLAAVREHGAKGIVLDLRGNPGGLRDQAVKITSEFLKGGDVFIEVDIHGRQNPVPVEPGGVAVDVPMVVLIDGVTASAAEICSGALQDYQRAKLVGQKTYGTGTVLNPFKLSDGSEVLLATLKWWTPNRHEIWHKGIVPDVEVKLQDPLDALVPEMEDDLTPAALQKSSDTQLLKALDLLREQVEGKAPAPEK